MSLTTRITLLVIGLLAVGIAASGAGIYAFSHSLLRDEIHERLDARLLWMQTSLEIEEGRLQLGPVPEAENAAPNWEIARPDGQVLWGSRSTHLHRPVVSVSRTRVMGDPGWPALPAGRLEQTNPPAGHAREKERDKNLKYFPYFSLPNEPRSVELVLTAWDSEAGMVAAKRRMRAILWTAGPAVLAAAALLFALIIRWQLRPLGEMAEQAGRIGPEDLSVRIAQAGTSMECVRLGDTINTMLGRLAEGLERERNFTSTAAHELRTPLAQLRTHLEVSLRRERSLEEYREALRYALGDVDRLQNLVQGLLQLARAADGRRVAGRPVGLWPLLRRVEKAFAPISLGPPGGTEDVFVSCDEGLLFSALGNVLENAARYAPGPPPEVRVAIEGGLVRLIVADRGPGVAEADRERIFAPLVRLEAARTIRDGDEGFGLGLTIARATVRQFGGDLICRPRQDGERGAEFVFSIPVSRRD